MAAEPFNSKGGYTVGIPPFTLFDANGNLTSPNANIGNVNISGNQVVAGNITANTFIGQFQGNISGNIVVPGQNTWVVFNNDGNAGTNQYFRYDYAGPTLIVNGSFTSDTYTLGSANLELCTTTSVFASSSSGSANQVLYSTPASTICAIDYTIIATDTVGQNRQTSKLIATILGSEVGYYEYGTIDVPAIGPGVGDFQVQYISGNIVLTVQPVTSTLVQYKIMITRYKE